MFHSSRSESCGTEGGGSIIYPATGACYLHHGDHAGEIALETERRLSSSSCSGAASGWSRRPRGTMSKWTNGASVSFTPIDPGSATINKEAFQVPRFKPLWGKQRLMHGCARDPFWVGESGTVFSGTKVAGQVSIIAVWWDNTCRERYREAQRANRKPGAQLAWRLL